jgi:hypothetical protein
MGSNRRSGNEARLLIPVAIDLASQTADPFHHLAVLGRRHRASCVDTVLSSSSKLCSCRLGCVRMLVLQNFESFAVHVGRIGERDLGSG